MSDWDSDSDGSHLATSNQENNQPRETTQYVRGGRGGRPNSTVRGRGNNQEQRNNKVISIPTSKIGLVIGRGGAKIRDLEYESDAKINITRNSSEANTNVTLFGSDSAIDRVEQMIKDLIIDRPPKQEQVKQDNNPNAAVAPIFTKNPYLVIDRHGNEVMDWAKANEDADREQRRRWDELPAIVKNFYNEDPHVAAMKPEDVNHWRLANNNIQVHRTAETAEADKIPNPVMTFEQAFQDYPQILDEIYKQKFTEPSPIQSQAWPILLKGENMIGIAQTGTGKTLAFLLPALLHIDGQPTPRDKRPGPTVLILAPTRELALQIEREVNKYNYKGIKTVCVYGGVDKRQQIEALSKGVDIVIATPGRLGDLIKSDHIKAMHFSYIVLDEADRMLDMGFEPQIRMSLYDVRPEYQCVMTSATWPNAVQQLAEKFIKNPIHVNVGSLDLAAVHTVTQKVWIVDETEKDSILYDFIQNMHPSDRVIVFCGRKATASDIAATLACKGIHCESLHSDRDQVDREAALEDMTNGVVNILVATDVASRGIDIKDLTHVINLDFPNNIEEYVHRIGRTGRAGRTGIALTLMTKYDAENAKPLINILREANQEIPYDLQKMADNFVPRISKRGGFRGRGPRRGGGGRGRGGSNWW